jgi:serine/threonine protein kinase
MYHSDPGARRVAAGTGTFGRVRLCGVKEEAKAAAKSLADDPRATYTDSAGVVRNAMPNTFALKIMKKSEVVRLKQVEHIRNEKEILGAINHPFLVTLFAVAQDKSNLYMLLEFIIGGMPTRVSARRLRARSPPARSLPARSPCGAARR